ncbi:tyrosine-type recombinase/integrase [Kitasatospora sp. NPDC091276]|uniref:tyrosine-type recombinase/integrase n=1 Tax=Kitasatospora sp. NPDC091276 TaxID=3155300 RepID=UPI0034385EE2
MQHGPGEARRMSPPSPASSIPTRADPHTASADTRHTYVTHLTEDGVDRRFIQQQVGHENDSSTAIYTHVSDDFMNTMLHKALAPVLAPTTSADKDR